MGGASGAADYSCPRAGEAASPGGPRGTPSSSRYRLPPLVRRPLGEGPGHSLSWSFGVCVCVCLLTKPMTRSAGNSPGNQRCFRLMVAKQASGTRYPRHLR